MADQDRNPVDELVDLLVYAPIGLLYEYDEVVPKLVRRGKSQVQLARVIGQVAIRQGGTDPAAAAAGALSALVARGITELGTAIGLAPPPEDESEVGEAGQLDPDVDDEAEPGQDDAGATTVGLPIASYDGLTAREVIALLDELDAAQQARIRAYEEANRARKTVLGKLDRLAAAER